MPRPVERGDQGTAVRMRIGHMVKRAVSHKAGVLRDRQSVHRLSREYRYSPLAKLFTGNIAEKGEAPETMLAGHCRKSLPNKYQ